MRNQADSCDAVIEVTEDFDSDDWEDFADQLGFDGNRYKAKAVISVFEDMRKEYKSAKVSAGYRLTVIEKITGSELEEPEEREFEMIVYKVDGLPKSILILFIKFNSPTLIAELGCYTVNILSLTEFKF